MRKICNLFLMLLGIMIFVSCSNEDYVSLKKCFFDNGERAQKVYDYDFVYDKYDIINKRKNKKDYEAAKLKMGFDFTCALGVWSGDTIHFLAYEVESNAMAKYILNNNSTFSNIHQGQFIYKNVISINHLSMYILLDMDYKENNDSYFTLDNKTYIKSYSTEKKIVFPESIEEISACCFLSFDIEEIVINSKLKKISPLAFALPNLKYIVLNDGLVEIGDQAFIKCKNLKYAILPNSIIRIYEEVFSSGNIYCEVEAKPEGWHENFAVGNAKVYWKGEWDYDENGIPYPLTEEMTNAETIS